ncbi:MAG: NlpC/P60 family protein [Peptostreptococcaceae bacterium]
MNKKTLIPIFASVALLSTQNVINADNVNDSITLNNDNSTSVIVLDEYIEKQFSVAIIKEGVAVKVRKSGRVINIAYSGEKLKILAVQGEWIELQVNEGISGWVPKRYVDIDKSEGYITGETVNFRKEDNIDSEIIEELVIGTELKVLEVSDEWIKVQIEGNEGFVSAKYLSEEAPIIEIEEDIEDEVDEIAIVSEEEVEEKIIEETIEEIIEEEIIEQEVIELEIVKPVTPQEETVIPEIIEPEVIGVTEPEFVIPESIEPEVVEPVIPESIEPEVVEPVVPEVVEPQIESVPEVSNASSVQAVLNLAYSKQGLPYKWGAEGPNSFDCSGFTSYVFRNAVGISLPRTSSVQSTFGTTVSKSNLQAGDLVFFGSSASNISHVGIYVGGGNMIHSPSSGKNISITSINSNYYSARFITAKRVL